jgi:hypothetical protein
LRLEIASAQDRPSTLFAMSVRVLQASSRAAAAVISKRAAVATASRAFSEVAKDEEAAKAAAAAAEEKLMAKLREQQFTEAERTGTLPPTLIIMLIRYLMLEFVCL